MNPSKVFDAGSVSWDRACQDNSAHCSSDDICGSMAGVDIAARIGSPSMNAVVYRIQLTNGTFAAAKVMPHIDRKSDAKAKWEIGVAMSLQMWVESQNRAYSPFPIVYSSGVCPYTVFDKSCSFGELADTFAMRTALAAQTKNPFRFIVLSRNQPFSTVIAMAQKQHLIIPNMTTLSIRSHVMVSELCQGDVIQMHAKHVFRAPQWQSILSQVVSGIIDMNDAGFAHHDLHAGNVLVNMLPDGQVRCFIHDFGLATLNSHSNGWQSDIEKFLDTIMRLENIDADTRQLFIDIVVQVENMHSAEAVLGYIPQLI